MLLFLASLWYVQKLVYSLKILDTRYHFYPMWLIWKVDYKELRLKIFDVCGVYWFVFKVIVILLKIYSSLGLVPQLLFKNLFILNSNLLKNQWATEIKYTNTNVHSHSNKGHLSWVIFLSYPLVDLIWWFHEYVSSKFWD